VFETFLKGLWGRQDVKDTNLWMAQTFQEWTQESWG